MGATADAFSAAFRNFVIDGDASSGTNEPDKSDLRALGAVIESQFPDGTSLQNQIDALNDALDSLVSYDAVPNDTSSGAKAVNTSALIEAGTFTTDLGFGGVDVPSGLFYTASASDELPPFSGRGYIIDSAGNRRGRHFSWIGHEPTVRAPDDGGDIETAFNGDLSFCQFPVEHRMTGDALGAAPSGGTFHDGLRGWTQEAYPFYTNLYVEAGAKHDIFFTTIGSGDHIDALNNSLGDVAARTTRIVAGKTKVSFTGTIDNGWALASLSEVIGAKDGVQLVGHEVNGYDQGFDIGYVGYNSWGMRTEATGAKYAHWVDYVAKSAGGDHYHDLAYALYGPFRIGTNYAGADFDEAGYEGAAITMKASQGIYWNVADGSVPDDYRWIPGDVGDVWTGYTTADGANALAFMNGDDGSIFIYADGIEFTGKLGFNTSPVTKPTVTGSRDGNAALASLCTALAALGLITNSTS